MTTYGEWVDSALYANTIHYLCLIHSCPYVFALLTSLTGYYGDFGWERLEVCKHVFCIINTVHENEPFIPFHCLS